jgi:hypothetical protein
VRAKSYESAALPYREKFAKLSLVELHEHPSN